MADEVGTQRADSMRRTEVIEDAGGTGGKLF